MQIFMLDTANSPIQQIMIAAHIYQEIMKPAHSQHQAVEFITSLFEASQNLVASH